MYFVIWKLKDIPGETYTSHLDYLNSDKIGINFLRKLCEMKELALLMLAWFFLSDVTESGTT